MNTLSANLLEAPDDRIVERAIEEYTRDLRREYASRLRGVYLFGSRARGEHSRESDADIAVVLADVDYDFWTEKMRLADLAYDVIVATNVHVQGWPVSESEWNS